MRSENCQSFNLHSISLVDPNYSCESIQEMAQQEFHGIFHPSLSSTEVVYVPHQDRSG